MPFAYLCRFQELVKRQSPSLFRLKIKLFFLALKNKCNLTKEAPVSISLYWADCKSQTR
jgi:hypothetical protein